jgi:5-methylcytosine-specific restriction endonuclease McrA
MIAAQVHDTTTTAAPLTDLSDESLLSRPGELTARERRITLRILDHLNEVERRKLFLKKGFRSMFAYCTRRLGYSESAANRRIRTARCIRRFPVVRERLERNRVNLSTVSIVAGLFTGDNFTELLARIEGASQDDARAIVAEYQPRAAVPDRIRPVSLVRNATPRSSRERIPTLACDHRRSGGKESATGPEGPGATSAAGSDAKRSDVTGALRAAAAADAGPAKEPPTATGTVRDAPVPAREQHYIVRFAAGSELVRRIEAARSLLSFRLPAEASLEEVLGAVLDEFIERNDPSRRTAQRAKRKENGKRKDAMVSHDPRAIPAAVRDRVMADAGGRCQYVSPCGHRCDATAFLQIDHILPVALGGTADTANLRVLCARHNRSEAGRLLGGGNGPTERANPHRKVFRGAARCEPSP